MPASVCREEYRLTVARVLVARGGGCKGRPPHSQSGSAAACPTGLGRAPNGLTPAPTSEWTPTRDGGLARLPVFLPVCQSSCPARAATILPCVILTCRATRMCHLSPWLRHRPITEAKVIQAFEHAQTSGADKFLAEVWVRTNLERLAGPAPDIWAGYRQGPHAALNRMAIQPGIPARSEAAMLGDTGIEGLTIGHKSWSPPTIFNPMPGCGSPRSGSSLCGCRDSWGKTSSCAT